MNGKPQTRHRFRWSSSSGRGVLFLAGWLLLSFCVAGQEEFGGGSSMRLSAWHFDWSDLDHSDTAVAIDRYSLSARISMVTLSVDETLFDWRNTETFPLADGQDPWNELHSVSLNGGWGTQLNRKLYFRLTGGVGAAFEEEPRECANVRLGAMLSWSAAEDWRFFSGLMGFWHEGVEPDYPVFPMFGAQWRRPIDPGWSASLGFPRTALQYRWNEQLALQTQALWVPGSGYRLADDNPALPQGYVSQRGQGLGLSLLWSPTINLTFETSLSRVTSRDLSLYDDHGSHSLDYELEPAWSVALTMSYRFP